MEYTYSVNCRDCSEAIPLKGLNRQGAEEIFNHIPQLIELKKIADTKLDKRMVIGLTRHKMDNFGEFVNWVVKHKGHELVLL